MGQVVAQYPCPTCGSLQGYHEYEDGGWHCFSCGYHGAGNAYKRLMDTLQGTIKAKAIGECQELPEDAAKKLPDKAHKWLDKYGITDAEIDEHQFLWSEEKQLLIFPVFDGNRNLVMWQGRDFSGLPKRPKYYTRGPAKDVMHILGGYEGMTSLVLTEDLISAIKVSRVHPAMPLWGSSLSKDMARRIALLGCDAKLFLDYDKRDYSIKMVMEHALTLHITPIITSLDAKCYSEEELKEILSGV